MTKTGKKSLALLLAALMLFSITPLNGLGELLATKVSAAKQGDYTYEVIDSEVTILDVKSSITGDVVIPATLPLNGVDYSVTRIGKRAFDYCNEITSVTFPDSVKTIGEAAFQGCSALKTVTLPESLEAIGDNAFENCSVLEGVTIPGNVTKIGGEAFSFCDALTNIVIPDSVTKIGSRAFAHCSGLTSVSIGKGVKDLGRLIFLGCGALTEITVDGENPYFLSEDGVLFNKDKTLLVSYPTAKADLSYTVPAGVTSVGYGAFTEARFLENVTISDSITDIETGAFNYCYNLETLNLGEGVKNIGDYAFEACIGLTSIEIPDSVITIGEQAFYYCQFAGNLTLGEGVTNIGDDAFSGCPLTSVTLPKSVTNLGESVFGECYNLTEILADLENPNYSNDENGILFSKDKKKLVAYPAGKGETNYTVPEGVTEIGEYSFYSNVALTDITVSDSVTVIGEGAFCRSNIENVAIGTGVTLIDDFAFYTCNALTGITVPDNVETIGDCAFYECSILETVDLGSGVTTIGDEAFGNCDTLTAITIPDSVTHLGDDAFYSCSALESAVIGNGVTLIGEYTFCYCDALENVTIGSGVTTIGENAFCDCDSLISIVIPDSVTVIDDCTFQDCYALKTVTFGNSLTYIGEDAFEWCGQLGEINIPEGVTYIGDWAFYRCEALATITLPDSLDYIGSNVFGWTDYYNETGNWENGVLYIGNHLIDTFSDNMATTDYVIRDGTITVAEWALAECDLTSLTIPGSVENLCDYALSGNGFTEINISSNLLTIGNGALADSELLETITVDGNNPNYMVEEGVLFDKDQTLLVAFPPADASPTYDIPGTVKTLGYCAFSYCDTLTQVTIPEGVTEIGPWAFQYCTNLADVTIPETVEEIGEGAFYGCRSFIDMEIPKGIAYIDYATFEECASLERVYIPNTVFEISGGAFDYCSSLTDVYYEGKVRNWDSINLGYSSDLRNAHIHCEGVEAGYKLRDGLFWFFVDAQGNATVTGLADYPGTDMEIPATCSDDEGEYPVIGIAEGAFYGMNFIRSVTIPKSITFIDEYAFEYCNGIRDVYYKGTEAQWNDIEIIEDGNEDLLDADIHFLGEEEEEFTEDFYTYTVDENGNATIIDVDEAINGDVEIPATLGGHPITGIGAGAFSNCNLITKLTIPNSITTIGANAFAGCGGFTDVYYQGTRAQWNAVTGTEALDGKEIHCTDDEEEEDEFTNGFYTYTLDENGNATITDVDEAISGEVEIPETLGGHPVTGIGDGAFSNCNLITKLTIPDSITDIGDNAFDGCDGFTDVYYEGTEAQWNAVTGTEALAGKTIHFEEDPDDPEDPGAGDYANAKLPGTPAQTARYKNNVTVKITATGIPANGFLVVDGTKVAPDATGKAVFEAEFQAKEGKTFKAHIEDAEGNVKVAEQEYKVNVDTGFFAKIVAFFMDFIFNGFKWKKVNVEF